MRKYTIFQSNMPPKGNGRDKPNQPLALGKEVHQQRAACKHTHTRAMLLAPGNGFPAKSPTWTLQRDKARLTLCPARSKARSLIHAVQLDHTGGVWHTVKSHLLLLMEPTSFLKHKSGSLTSRKHALPGQS